jgi:hypothetical protein
MTVHEYAPPRERDSRGLLVDGMAPERLSREECLDLLASLPIGRLIYTRQALPAVQPVNFAVSDGEVIIRAGAGGKVAAAARGDVVAFEADALDISTRSGWSVTVIGRSRRASEPAEISRLRMLPLVSWAPGAQEHFICIGIEIVSGRRFRPARDWPDGLGAERI